MRRNEGNLFLKGEFTPKPRIHTVPLVVLLILFYSLSVGVETTAFCQV